MTQILDFIGIGFGPANIALAIQLQENNLEDKLKYLFIDNNKDSLWQREMLISGTDIQNVPVRDLITPINPRSYYSFINYLHKNDRYFKYYGTGLAYPLRQDYAMYINWCASHFKHIVHYQETVINIDIAECGSHYIVQTNLATYCTKIVIMATGRSLFVPEVFNNIPENKLITINNFISKISELHRELEYKFAVVGASQSAAEIFLKLADTFYNSNVHSYIRKFSFVVRDSSPFSYEVFLPEFIDEYYKADDKTKISLNNHLRRTNYSSADIEVLDKINIKMYEESLSNNYRIEIKRNSEILETSYNGKNITIKSRNTVNNSIHVLDYDFVIVCTGFRDLGKNEDKEYLPPLLEKFASKLVLNYDKESMTRYISEDYELYFDGINKPVYLNGLCETSHGMGDAGSFGLISIRVNKIMNSLINHLKQ
ncbi:MAG: lysine N6-hydroxylase/L-ornithine N5-oxygenase family protein [Burkholderiales bacterium]|jgi:L-ornithine N5-oxygenase|nr:lysine N6-hydroxylase/L-ornithine N5-oxygenase family protein [Burkholderiales bacterium]